METLTFLDRTVPKKPIPPSISGIYEGICSINTSNKNISFIKKFLIRHFCCKMKSRQKRAIILSSLAAMLLEDDKLYTDTTKFIDYMIDYDLAYDTKEFMRAIRNWIWKKAFKNNAITINDTDISLDTVVKEKLTDDVLGMMAIYYYEHMPDCMVYGNRSTIITDIYFLLKHINDSIGSE